MARTLPIRNRQFDVLIVDARPEDYLSLATQSAAGGWKFQFASSGSDALKLARPTSRSIWLVNIHLPDGSGCELAASIRARNPHSVVCLVSDQYDPAEELKARMAGGALYACKPVEAAWLTLTTSQTEFLSQCA